MPFSEIVFRAAREGKTGTLVLTDGTVNKALHFLQGNIVGGRSNLPAESLAKLMVVRGKATREQVEGLGVQLLNDEAVEHALHQAGIEHDDIEEVMSYQLLLRISDTFARPSLGFCWTEIESVGTLLSINAYQVFTEGVARRMTREQSAAQTASLADQRPQITAGQTVFTLDYDSLPPRAAQLFRRIDGRMTFKELVESVSRTSPPDQVADTMYRAWVYLLAFLEAGFIELSEGSASAVRTVQADEPGRAASASPSVTPPSAAVTPPPAPAEAPAPSEGEGTVMVVSEAGGGAVAYHEVEDPAITARYHTMQKQNFYEVLAVAEDANDVAVKKAYFKLAKEFHPDKLYNHKERTVKKYADHAFAIVNKAYEQLKSEPGRKEYSVKIKELSQGLDLDKEAEGMLKAEMEFQKGVVFLRKKDFANAVTHFRNALEANPRESDHFAYSGWAEFQVHYPGNESGWKDAVFKMEKAVELDPKSFEAPFFLGQALKLTGNLDKAGAMFQKVLKLRPHHADAQRELRLMEQRKAQAAQDAPKDKNPFGKIFK